MRNRFDRQLEELNNGLINMGSLIEQAIEAAVDGLVQQDVEKATNLDWPEAKVISEYQELEPFMQTIRPQHENILRAAKMRQDFTANVSHELKTPLTAISGYAELMEAGMVQESEINHYAGEIRHNSNRLLALINDIIHLSEMDRTEYEVQMQPVNLAEL